MTKILLAYTDLLFRDATPAPDFDPTTVTPGTVGFIAMGLIALVTIFLIVDLNRRVRRVNYRAEAAERLDAEQAADAERAANDDATS